MREAGEIDEDVMLACVANPTAEGGEGGEGLARLEAKIEAGAEMVISLPIFEAAEQARFVGDARNAGVACPVVPGILPLCTPSDFRRLCRALYVEPPAALERQLEAAAAKGEDAVGQLAQATLVRLVDELKAQGGSAPHVYTLNSPAALSYLAAAGFRPLKHRTL